MPIENQRVGEVNAYVIVDSVINSDFIIIGNSRAACSFNTKVIDSILCTNSFNQGVSGQPFGVSYLRYCLYRKKNIAPKELLINVDQSEMNLYSNGFERQQYLPYFGPFFYDIDSLLNEAIDANEFKWIDKNLPLLRYRGEYKYLSLGILEYFHLYHIPSSSYKGYRCSDSQYDGTYFRKEKSMNKAIVCNQNDEAFYRLNLLLNQCEEEHVKVYLVFAPIYKDLKEYLDSSSFSSLYEKYISLSALYPKTVSFLDYSDPNSNICRDSIYFNNANHLNLKGSIKFSKQLSYDISSLRNGQNNSLIEIF